MERSANYPTHADVRAGIRAEQNKKPLVDANGRPLAYAEQPQRYRDAVTRDQHVAAHGR